MYRLIAIRCGCLVSVLLASCSKPAHDVAYYMQHEGERNAMLEKCKANPDLISRDENCQAAGNAQFRSGSYTPSKPQKW